MLLDEPTASPDARNEQALAGAVAANGPSTTVLVVAHRLSTVVDADRMVVRDDGRVVATGTHDELVERSVLHRDLAAPQLLVQPFRVRAAAGRRPQRRSARAARRSRGAAAPG